MNKKLAVKLVSLLVLVIAVVSIILFNRGGEDTQAEQTHTDIVSEEASTSVIDDKQTEESSTEEDTQEEDGSAAQVGEEFVIELEDDQETGEIN